MMRSFLLFLIMVFAACAPLRADEAKPVPDAERLSAAREMMEATGVTKSLEGVIANMSQNFAQSMKTVAGAEAGQQASATFESVMKRFLAYKEDMLNDFAVLYAETFTAAEMKEVTAFYKSGTGAKFVAEMPGLMQKGSQIGMKYSQKILEEMGAGKK